MCVESFTPRAHKFKWAWLKKKYIQVYLHVSELIVIPFIVGSFTLTDETELLAVISEKMNYHCSII